MSAALSRPRPGRRRWLAILLLAGLSVAAPSLAADAPDDALAGPALLSALRAGGLILSFRHTSTDFGQNDDRAIGVAIQRLRIPIGDVLASPFCRTRETAQLIFGRLRVDAAVRGGPASDDANRYAGLRRLLSTPPADGTVLAIASHGNPFRAVAGTPYLAEGEAAVVKPLGERGFRVIARIPKDGWSALDAR